VGEAFKIDRQSLAVKSSPMPNFYLGA
jgi:hypothetical protein